MAIHINVYLHNDGTATYVAEESHDDFNIEGRFTHRESSIIDPKIAIEFIQNGCDHSVLTGLTLEEVKLTEGC